MLKVDSDPMAPGSSFSKNALPLTEPHPYSAKVKGDLKPAITGYTDGFGYILASAAVAFLYATL